MSPALQELRAIIVEHRTQFSNDIVEASRAAPQAPNAGPVYSKQDTLQMVHGFFELLLAALDGRDKEMREMYLDVVMPSLRDAGTPAGQMIGGSAIVLFLITANVSARLSNESRSEAVSWLSTYLGTFLGEVNDIWSERS